MQQLVVSVLPEGMTSDDVDHRITGWARSSWVSPLTVGVSVRSRQRAPAVRGQGYPAYCQTGARRSHRRHRCPAGLAAGFPEDARTGPLQAPVLSALLAQSPRLLAARRGGADTTR